MLSVHYPYTKINQQKQTEHIYYVANIVKMYKI